MPIYEYKCGECSHQLEAIQKVNDAPLSDCPACGRPALKRLLSAAGFQLKGSGWYATDFKSNGQKPNEQKKEEKSSSDGSEGTSTKAHSCGAGACGCAH
ncbi:MAG: FmdB family zinc ribbon protein [Sulfurifustis sp.]